MTRREAIEKQFYNFSDRKKVCLWNHYCLNGTANPFIYSFDDPETFIKQYFKDPYEAFCAGKFGKVSFSADWIAFNGYKNLVTEYNPVFFMCLDDLFTAIDENFDEYAEYFNLDEIESEDE